MQIKLGWTKGELNRRIEKTIEVLNKI